MQTLTLNTFKVTVGDWSHDGHGLTDTFIVNSSITSEQLKTAIKATADMLDMDYTDHTYFFRLNYCSDYENNKFPVSILNAMDFDLDTLDDIVDPDDETAYIGPEDWMRIHIHMAKRIYPDAVIEIVNMPSLTIGGYGLFNC